MTVARYWVLLKLPKGSGQAPVHSWASSAKYDPIEPGKSGAVDKGGCVNILTPSRMMSPNAPGMVPNSCLVEVAKWDG